MTDIPQEVGMCKRCWGKAFTAAYGIGSKTQAGEYERIVATCACTQAQRLGVDDSFAEGYKAALASQEQRRVEELQRELKEAVGDAAILAHAYSADNRPPTNVVVRSIDRGKKAIGK